MGRRAVALHAGAQQREPAEDGIERIERARPGDDQHLGAFASERRQLVGHDARRAAGVVDGEKATPEPLDLLLQRRLEPRALLGVEALLRDRADRRRSEAAHRHEPVRVTGDLLDGAQRLGGNDERRDLALADRLAGLDRLGFEEREDRNPL